jgi:Family of unknown function (DUF6465)
MMRPSTEAEDRRSWMPAKKKAAAKKPAAKKPAAKKPTKKPTKGTVLLDFLGSTGSH